MKKHKQILDQFITEIYNSKSFELLREFVTNSMYSNVEKYMHQNNVGKIAGLISKEIKRSASEET